MSARRDAITAKYSKHHGNVNAKSLKGGALQSLGEALYDADVHDEYDRRREYFRNRGAAGPLSMADVRFAHEAQFGPKPSELARGEAGTGGFRAMYGLLGPDVRMSFGPSAPGSNQIRGRYAGPGEDKRDYPAGVVGPGTFDTPQGFNLLDSTGQNAVLDVADAAKGSRGRYESMMRSLLRSGQLNRR